MLKNQKAKEEKRHKSGACGQALEQVALEQPYSEQKQTTQSSWGLLSFWEERVESTEPGPETSCLVSPLPQRSREARTGQKEVCPPTSQQGHMRPEPSSPHRGGVHVRVRACVCVCPQCWQASGPRPQEGTFLQLLADACQGLTSHPGRTSHSTQPRVQLLAWPGGHTAPQLCRVPNGLGIFPDSRASQGHPRFLPPPP